MSFLTNLTLGKKITLLTTLGLVFGAGVFSTLGIRAVNHATETMLQDRLTTARLVADFVDDALTRALSELEHAAGLVAGRASVDSLGAEMAALEDIYSRQSIPTDGIYLLDGTGQVVWPRLDGGEAASIDLSAYPSIARALQSRRSGTSGLVSAPFSGAPAVLLFAPTTVGTGGPPAVLVVAVDVSQSSISGFVQPITLGETGYVEIVDQAGTVVARTEPGPALSPFEKSDHSGRFADLIEAGKPARGVCHTCHEGEQTVQRKDVLAFVPLSQTRWGVVIRQSEEEALASTRELQRSLLLFGAGLVVVALLLVTVTTRDIGTRIRDLTSASRGIAEGDLVSPVKTLGRDEVGMLAQTLDDMRLKLKKSYSDLEQRTQELSSLLSVSEILTSPQELPRLLEAVVAKAVDIIPVADGGALVLNRGDGRGPAVEAAIGIEADTLAEVLASGGDGPSPGASSRSETVAAILDAQGRRVGVLGAIAADVAHHDRHIGSLVMISLRDSRAFSESDRRLLQSIADYMAIAIERAQLARQAEEAHALQEADRLRSEFISSVSHELRTPLTLIKGYCTSLLRQNVSWDEETQREFLQIVDEKTDQLRDLIDKLLQSAKLEAGALRLEKEPVLIPRLARRVAQEIVSRSDKHRLAFRFSRAFPVVEVDAQCLEQVLRNLVENAVKYSPDGGRVLVSGHVRDGDVVVSVSDEGIGIPPEYRGRVFERFYRVDNPATRSTHGSGLGLSIAKGHIEAHGGRVWVESANGGGSKFSFSLPMGNEVAAAPE